MSVADPSRRRSPDFIARCLSRPNLVRAVRTALIVGPILTVINQTEVVGAVLSLEAVSAGALVRICLTFLVPFTVSLFSSAAADMAGQDSDAWGDATYHGPSIMYYYTESTSTDISFRAWWVNCHTPINPEEVDLCSGVIVSSLDERPLPDEFLETYPQVAHIAFGQDVEIWKDKVYREEPILCDGDGPVNKLRKWYEQFYLPL